LQALPLNLAIKSALTSCQLFGVRLFIGVVFDCFTKVINLLLRGNYFIK